MITKNDLSEIGLALKSHGIRGEVIISSTINLNELDIDFIFFELNGCVIPFAIEDFNWNGKDGGILKLKEVNEKESKELITSHCYINSKLLANNELKPNIFTFENFELIDITVGSIGKIIDIDQQSHNLLFVVETGQQEELLIPAAEEYLIEIKKTEMQLIVNLPEGLLDL